MQSPASPSSPRERSVQPGPWRPGPANIPLPRRRRPANAWPSGDHSLPQPRPHPGAHSSPQPRAHHARVAPRTPSPGKIYDKLTSSDKYGLSIPLLHNSTLHDISHRDYARCSEAGGCKGMLQKLGCLSFVWLLAIMRSDAKTSFAL